MTYEQPQWSAPPSAPPPTSPYQRPKTPWWRKRWALPVGVGVVALLLGVGIGAGSKPKAAAAAHTVTSVTATVTQQVTTTPTQVVSTQQVVTTVTFTPQPANQFTNGVQLVGTDIPAGTYKTDGQGDGSNAIGCYYAILNSSDTNDISSNVIISGPTRVVLKAGKYFESSGGCSWARVG